MSIPSTRFCSRSTSGMPADTERLRCDNENAAAAIGKSRCEQAQVIKLPSAAPKPRRRSSRIAPLAGNRSRAGLPGGDGYRRSESPGKQVRCVTGAEQSRADRIGPQHTGAVAHHSQTGWFCWWRVRPAVHRQRPATENPHCSSALHALDSLGARPVSASWCGPNDDILNNSLISPARTRRVHVRPIPAGQSSNNVNPSEGSAFCRTEELGLRWQLQNKNKGPRWDRTRMGRRVTSAIAKAQLGCSWRLRETGLWIRLRQCKMERDMTDQFEIPD